MKKGRGRPNRFMLTAAQVKGGVLRITTAQINVATAPPPMSSR